MLYKILTNKQILETIGGKLKDERLRQNITQEYLSEKVGISLTSIKKIEKGESVSFNIFISYLRALNLLERLDKLLPETVISPIEWEKINKKRKKASTKINKTDKSFFE
jgi:transcriptional regulator with XRE-family HTH domain